MANDKKLLCEEENIQDRQQRTLIYSECDPHLIQILLHAVQPEPETFSLRQAIPKLDSSCRSTLEGLDRISRAGCQ